MQYNTRLVCHEQKYDHVTHLLWDDVSDVTTDYIFIFMNHNRHKY